MGAVLLNNSKEPIEYFFCREPIKICCRDEEKMATQAQTKPLALTLTSVTVQIATPTTTTTTDSFTSLEYRLLWRIHSMTHTTGIMLSFEIYATYRDD